MIDNQNSPTSDQVSRVPRWRSLKLLFILQLVIFVAACLANALGIVQFHYARMVDNDPLVAPVEIVATSKNGNILLADGRAFQIDRSHEGDGRCDPLDGMKVDIEYDVVPNNDGYDTAVCYSVHKDYSTAFQTALITIPLVPRKESKNFKHYGYRARLIDAQVEFPLRTK